MIDHKLHWPEIGYSAFKETDARKRYNEWMEHGTFRKVLYTVLITSDLIYLAVTAALAWALLTVLDTQELINLSGDGVVWAFTGSVAIVMIVDEIFPKGKHSAIRSGAVVLMSHVMVTLVRLYSMVKHRRDDSKQPEAIPSTFDRVLLPRWGVSRGKDKLN